MTQVSNLKVVEGISKQSISFFGTKKKVKEFFDLVATCGSVALASSRSRLSPLEVQEVINNDVAMQKLASRSLKLALEIAEGILYDRAVNGYTEETIVDGVKTGEKKKYSDSCLVNYLKANSGKYNNKSVAGTAISDNIDVEVVDFE